MFTDNGVLYSGAITANGSQQTGLAGRISVNTALLGDPSRTIVYSTNPLTAAGDTTRSDFILIAAVDGHAIATRRRPASAPPVRRSPAR